VTGSERSPRVALALVIGVTVVLSVALSLVHLPSAVLLAALIAVSLVVGLALARVMRFPTASLLGPLAVAVALALGGWLGEVRVPTPVQWAAFALIGAQVGLRFTRASLASITRMLPAVLALTFGMVAATAGVGALLAWATPVDGLTAYLATTPGGLFAVLSTAADAGSDVTYVLAVQLCRLLVILALTTVSSFCSRGGCQLGAADSGSPSPSPSPHHSVILLLARWLSARRGRRRPAS
jgi:membrane AbrB-like protein